MILGHERQIEYLEKVIRRGRMAHAYLFYGPEHVGKFALAKEVARVLICPNKNKIGDAGDGCADCRQIKQDIHPGAIILDIEHTLVSKKEIRKDIPIEDIRELKRKFSFAPEAEKWRIAIINEAEKLSQEAANAFLKLLEEPGERTLFLLISSAHDSVLPTIVSRAEPLRFSLLPDGVLRKFLEEKKVKPDKADAILAAASGRPGIALRALEDPSFLLKQEKMRNEVESILALRDIPSALVLAERVSKNKEECRIASEFLIGTLRKNLCSAVSQKKSYQAAASRLKEIHRILSILETTNVNPRLAMDVMFMEALTTNSTNRNEQH